MTIMFELHIGYLVGWDANGVFVGIGRNPRWAPNKGLSVYRWSWSSPFPWWTSPLQIRGALWAWRLNRKYWRRQHKKVRAK